MWIKEGLPFIKDVTQILFFLIVGIVTILTYSKAKKSLLQPIRTEIFKEQLKVFSDILGLFSGKEEHELRDDFAFEKLFKAADLTPNYVPTLIRESSTFPVLYS